jgi:hypothetical protein
MKKFFLFFLSFFIFILFVLPVKAEEIKNFDTQIFINKDGTIDVTEKFLLLKKTKRGKNIY